MLIPYLLSLLLFVAPQVSVAASPSVIIESVEIGSPSAQDEYIVLRNIGATPIDISKWSIQTRTNGSTSVQKKNFNPETIIQPEARYRIAHANGRFAATANMTYTTLSLVEKGGVLGLFNSTSYASTFEEATLVSSYNYNLQAEQKTPTSAETATQPSPPSAPNTKAVTQSPEYIGEISRIPKNWPVRLSELLPNPELGDEYIEIENTSGEGVDVSGLWIKDASGASYALGSRGENTVLGAYEFRIWPRSQTRIALNNTDGDIVILSDQSNQFADEIYYPNDALPGNAYARLGKSWLWTTHPTPSAKNYISPQQTPPYARAEIPSKPLLIHESFSVSAADSTDLNDHIVSYVWDFGDGKILSGIKQTYSYTATGTYTISLLITDSFGATSTVSRGITVVEPEKTQPKVSISAAGVLLSKTTTKKVASPQPQYSGTVQIPPGIIGRRKFVVNGRTVEFTTDRKELPLLRRGSIVSFSGHEVFKSDRLILQITARDVIKVAAMTTAPPYAFLNGTVSAVDKTSFFLATTSTDYLVQSGLRYSNNSRVEVGDNVSLSGVLLTDDAEHLTIVVPTQQQLIFSSKVSKKAELPNSFYNILILACTTGSLVALHLFLTKYGKNYAPTRTSEYLRSSVQKFRSLPKQITDYIQAR